MDVIKQIRNDGTGPLEQEDIKARVVEAHRTKKYMIAVWSIESGTLAHSMATSNFPTADLETAEEQFLESMQKFKLAAIKKNGQGIVKPASAKKKARKAKPRTTPKRKTPRKQTKAATKKTGKKRGV